MAIKGDRLRFEKGLYLTSFKRHVEFESEYKTIILYNTERKRIIKFYGKRHIIRIFSTRMVLTEKSIVKKVTIAIENNVGFKNRINSNTFF